MGDALQGAFGGAFSGNVPPKQWKNIHCCFEGRRQHENTNILWPLKADSIDLILFQLLSAALGFSPSGCQRTLRLNEVAWLKAAERR